MTVSVHIAPIFNKSPILTILHGELAEDGAAAAAVAVDEAEVHVLGKRGLPRVRLLQAQHVHVVPLKRVNGHHLKRCEYGRIERSLDSSVGKGTAVLSLGWGFGSSFILWICLPTLR